MRPALAILIAASLVASPVLAQGKAKAPKVAPAIEALEVCEALAANQEGAVEAATERGWEVAKGTAESPYVETSDLNKTIPGLGAAEGYVLIESYPGVTFGYCRIDVYEPDGEADVRAIDGLDRWDGTIKDEGAGTYGSWQGTDDPNYLLLAHEDEYSFVLQLTIITTDGAPFPASAR